MSETLERYDTDGNGYFGYGNASPPLNDAYLRDFRSQDREHRSSKSMERDDEHNNHHRDHNDMSDRRENETDKVDDHNRHRSRDRIDDHNRHQSRDIIDDHNRHQNRDRADDHNRRRSRDRVDDHNHRRSRDRVDDHNRRRSRDRVDDHNRHRSRDRVDDHNSHRSRDRVDEHNSHRSRDRVDDHKRHRSRDRVDDHNRHRSRDRFEDHEHDRHRRHHRRDYDGYERYRGHDADDYDHHNRNYDRDYGRDSERRHRHESHSRSRDRHSHKSRSRSRSRSKSKRISGFDMPPQVMMPNVTAPGQIRGTTPAVPGIFPNIFPLTTGQAQLPTIPLMPVQAMTQQATRHARRVYVGGLSASANEQTVAVFFSQVMSAIGGNTSGPGDAVVNVYINHEKKFAFVEMRSVEEASNAMALDGIIFEGAPVKVRRPSDYNPSLAAALGPCQPNPNLNLGVVGLMSCSAAGLEGPDRIFVGGLPYYFTEAQVRELLESFGALRGFDLVKDKESGNSKGYAFCVYQDLTVTDIACAALNGIKMGDKTLTVRRANQGASQTKAEQENMLLQAQQQVAIQRLVLHVGSLPTKVVCLIQVVSADELRDDEEYQDILDDMKTEGEKYGNLVKVVIPRPGPSGEMAPGVGRVFLEYADIEGSTKARLGMHGRKFGGNQVSAFFYQESKYAQGEYDS